MELNKLIKENLIKKGFLITEQEKYTNSDSEIRFFAFYGEDYQDNSIRIYVESEDKIKFNIRIYTKEFGASIFDNRIFYGFVNDIDTFNVILKATEIDELIKQKLKTLQDYKFL